MTKSESTPKKASSQPKTGRIAKNRKQAGATPAVVALAPVVKHRKPASSLPSVVRALASSAAGFLGTGNRFANVDDVLDPATPTRSGQDLSILELQRLTLRRLKHDKHFVPLLMFGVPGVITRKRALEEVKALSLAGKYLMDLDQSYLGTTLRQHREMR